MKDGLFEDKRIVSKHPETEKKIYCILAQPEMFTHTIPNNTLSVSVPGFVAAVVAVFVVASLVVVVVKGGCVTGIFIEVVVVVADFVIVVVKVDGVGVMVEVVSDTVTPGQIKNEFE